MSVQYMPPQASLKPCLLINGIGCVYGDSHRVGNTRLRQVISGILWRFYLSALRGRLGHA
jgi:hypothetical protein